MPAQTKILATIDLAVMSTDPLYVGRQVDLLELITAQALARGIARRAMADAVCSYARSSLPGLGQAGSTSCLAAVLGDELAAAHDKADRELQIFARALAALRNGNGEIVRWHRSKDAPIYWGIHKPNAVLGALPFLLTVIIIAGVISATAWWLSDTVGAAAKVSADAQLLRQETIAKLLERAKALRAQGKVAQADGLEAAASGAVRAAESPPPGLLDQILSGAGVAAAAGGIGVAGLALLWALTRRSSSSKTKRRYRFPVSFHKPVTFRSPVH